MIHSKFSALDVFDNALSRDLSKIREGTRTHFRFIGVLFILPRAICDAMSCRLMYRNCTIDERRINSGSKNRFFRNFIFLGVQL